MGHERYSKGEPILGNRPPDAIARALLDTGNVDDVHVYAQTITVTVSPGQEPIGLKEIIEDLYTYYKPGVPVPSEADFS
jgi:hypothetical protein